MAEENTTPAIYKAIVAVMSEIGAVGKDRRNQQQGFQYRGIDDVMNELHAALAHNGVFVVPEVLDETRSSGKTRSGGDLFYTRLKTRFAFYASDGSHVDAVVIGEAMDSGDKASNKALSVGLKYAMMQVFCIPTEDDKDPDVTSQDVKPGTMKPQLKGGDTTPEEKAELNELFKAKKADGSPAFTVAEAKKYSEMRATKTAREVIDLIKAELQKRVSALPPEVEAVKQAMGGEAAPEAKPDLF
jgi:hypothetical protein